MASYPPPPPPPPPPGPPYGSDWRYQRRVVREQDRMQRDAYRAQRAAYRYQMRGLRRSSIVGPVLIVAIGIIFLLVQTGHMSGRDFWAWYGHWWPMLFLGAGIIMLAEWAFDQYFLSNSNQPHYRRRVGGGVFFLLLLVVRGLPSFFLYRQELVVSQRAQMTLLTATSLPLLVALAEVGLSSGAMLPENAAALVGAGVLSVMVFPGLAVALNSTAPVPASGETPPVQP